MTDIVALVEDAKAKGTFSVLDAARGRSYPQDIVNVYTDANAAYEVSKLETRINDEKDNATLEALAAEQKALKEEVKASVLTFRLRGIGHGLVKRISAEADVKFKDSDDVGARNEWSNFSILAAHIQDVTDADGNVDNHKWSTEDIFELQDELPDSEFDKINLLMMELSFSADLFDASVTADFLLA